MENKVITVTSPLLPSLEDFIPYLEDIWNRKWLTNNGYYHKELEKALCEYLKVPYVSLFTNGTLPLICALQALRITGEVITTPYSFVATTHSLWWNGIKPVFVDIDPVTCNIDPDKIEAAITPKTTAIMPVHVYGKPCDTSRIQEIADKYGLKVIYDAAHAFGVEVNGEPQKQRIPFLPVILVDLRRYRSHGFFYLCSRNHHLEFFIMQFYDVFFHRDTDFIVIFTKVNNLSHKVTQSGRKILCLQNSSAGSNVVPSRKS